MTTEGIIQEFRDRVCAEIHLAGEGLDRFRVLTPFMFEDGDHLAIVLKREATKWILTDEGHTYMHLTYDLDEKDLQRGTRQKVISNALSTFRVNDIDGELYVEIRDNEFGDALYSFIQALLKVTDVSFLSRERVRSTFLEDFREYITERVPESRRSFDWKDPEHDAKGIYPVDCRINGVSRPLFVYALLNDDRTRDATISMLQYEKWGLVFRSLAIFEEQASINRNVLARFSDVCEKQFSTLAANKERITKFLADMLTEK